MGEFPRKVSAVLPSLSKINVFHAREPFLWVLLFSLNGARSPNWLGALTLRCASLCWLLTSGLTGVFAGRSM